MAKTTKLYCHIARALPLEQYGGKFHAEYAEEVELEPGDDATAVSDALRTRVLSRVLADINHFTKV